MDFKQKIRVIPDYPESGIRFKDITTLLKDGMPFNRPLIRWRISKKKKIDLIVGPEARGFVIGAPIAYALGDRVCSCSQTRQIAC